MTNISLTDKRPPKEDVHSISHLTDRIKSLLERSLRNVWIEGEISNLTLHGSGHWYLTLKDAKAQISGVMFKFANNSVNFKPENGMKVLACGDISVYPPRGNYQIKLTKMLPVGVGSLQLAFEELKKKLKDEGLFDDQYKQPIPYLPKKIGVITSPTGAAVRDIINVLTRRFPNIDVLLAPVRVQGDLAAAEITAAIEQLNNEGSCDVLIVGRGGGSIEDLWPFNEEIVARAIFASKIPIISAVGHETDFTIADFTADLRAPTPSAAAELAIPEKQGLTDEITRLHKRSLVALQTKLQKAQDAFKTGLMQRLINRPLERIERSSQELDYAIDRLTRGEKQHIETTKQKVAALIDKINILNPVETLKRGFLVATISDTTKIIKQTSDVAPGTLVDLKVIDGRIRCEVKKQIREDIDGQGKIF